MKLKSDGKITIQTDAIKNYIIPNCDYRDNLQWLPYAEEADLLNVALFGFTAKAWRESNPELAKSSNVRDYATINELTVLSIDVIDLSYITSATSSEMPTTSIDVKSIVEGKAAGFTYWDMTSVSVHAESGYVAKVMGRKCPMTFFIL